MVLELLEVVLELLEVVLELLELVLGLLELVLELLELVLSLSLSYLNVFLVSAVGVSFAELAWVCTQQCRPRWDIPRVWHVSGSTNVVSNKDSH